MDELDLMAAESRATYLIRRGKMKRKKKIVLAIIIGILVCCVTEISDTKQRVRKAKQVNALKIQSIEATNVLYAVAVKGEVVIQEDRVVITVLRRINEKELFLRISYYNAETESELTLEQAKEQFEIYTENCEFLDGYTDELEDFCAFAHEKGIPFWDGCIPYEKYRDKVHVILKEMGVEVYSPTLELGQLELEQYEEACQKALEDED